MTMKRILCIVFAAAAFAAACPPAGASPAKPSRLVRPSDAHAAQIDPSRLPQDWQSQLTPGVRGPGPSDPLREIEKARQLLPPPELSPRPLRDVDSAVMNKVIGRGRSDRPLRDVDSGVMHRILAEGDAARAAEAAREAARAVADDMEKALGR
jgi:hypothetical protein